MSQPQCLCHIIWQHRSKSQIEMLARHGREVPAEHALTDMARIYTRRQDMEWVTHYSTDQQAYALWLGFPKGVRSCFRGSGDDTPVYLHDYVDKQ